MNRGFVALLVVLPALAAAAVNQKWKKVVPGRGAVDGT
jgi:hypothetical protein